MTVATSFFKTVQMFRSMIIEHGRRIPYELKTLHVEPCLFTRERLLEKTKTGRCSALHFEQGRKEPPSRMGSAKNYEDTSSCIFIVGHPNTNIYNIMLCPWLYQLVEFYYGLSKPKITITTDGYETKFIGLSHMLKAKRLQHSKRHDEWFCSMTVLNHMSQKWSRHNCKLGKGKCSSNHHILQTLLPHKINCLDTDAWPGRPTLQV